MCISSMTKTLTDKNALSRKIYINNNTAIGSTSDTFLRSINNNTYVIFFYGELYNKEEIKEDLSKKYEFINESDAELVLLSYIEYNENALNIFNGIYSFVILNTDKDKLFFARDRLGVKPLYFSKVQDFVFSTEIKAMFKHPNVIAKIGKEEICEIFGLGPAHTLGKTFFKDIYEILPGHYATYENSVFEEFKYWDLETRNINDNIDEEIAKVKELVIDSLKREVKTDKKICSMLSGGIDSSILTYLAHNEIKDLNTFSIDFEDNNVNFKGSFYQPTKDSDYITIMLEHFKTNHTNLYFNTSEILSNLKEAMLARDMPGMADVDSSILIFLKKIKEIGFDIALSGECSDEIFGGYPWYYKEHLTHSINFPFSRAISARTNIVNNAIVSKEFLQNYIQEAYNKTCSNIVYNSHDLKENMFRKTCYNTIKWFMNTLIERTDRMCVFSGLDVRIPYADYRIFEYVYNIPYKHKLGLVNGNEIPIEKYILRKAFENELPKEIINRKKSPFPKTYDPLYTSALENLIKELINNSTSPLLEIINIKYLYEMLETKGDNLKENWFGQLMTYPQTLAYLLQINMWLEEYNVLLEV